MRESVSQAVQDVSEQINQTAETKSSKESLPEWLMPLYSLVTANADEVRAWSWGVEGPLSKSIWSHPAVGPEGLSPEDVPGIVSDVLETLAQAPAEAQEQAAEEAEEEDESTAAQKEEVARARQSKQKGKATAQKEQAQKKADTGRQEQKQKESDKLQSEPEPKIAPAAIAAVPVQVAKPPEVTPRQSQPLPRLEVVPSEDAVVTAAEDNPESDAPEFVEAEVPEIVFEPEPTQLTDEVFEASDVVEPDEYLEEPAIDPEPEATLPPIGAGEPVDLAEEEVVIINRFEDSGQPESTETPEVLVAEAAAPELTDRTAPAGNNEPQDNFTAPLRELDEPLVSRSPVAAKPEAAATADEMRGAIELPVVPAAVGEDELPGSQELEADEEPDMELFEEFGDEPLPESAEPLEPKTMPWLEAEESKLKKVKAAGDAPHDKGTREAVIGPLPGSNGAQNPIYVLGDTALQLSFKAAA